MTGLGHDGEDGVGPEADGRGRLTRLRETRGRDDDVFLVPVRIVGPFDSFARLTVLRSFRPRWAPGAIVDSRTSMSDQTLTGPQTTAWTVSKVIGAMICPRRTVQS